MPAGFAVTTDAFRDALGEQQDLQDCVRALPDALAAEVAAALAELGDRPVAVRSSGVAEDLGDRSFAGQYDSVLDVRGPAAVLEAVRTCWASAFSDRLAGYGGAGEVGVLVQVMVPAVVAGVAFSVNPATGDDETVLSAVAGLGERLMAGEVSADEWTVADGLAKRTGGEPVLTEADALRVAELTARVAAHFGCPQDVEWALAGGELHLLQARPITALPRALDEPVPAGFWARDHNTDGPPTPMQRSVFVPVYRRAAPGVFAFTTGAAPRIETIRGWTYLSTAPDTFAELAARMERIAERIAAGEPRALIDRWHRQWRPGFAARLAELRAVRLGGLDDAALVRHARAVLDVFDELHAVYFRLTGASVQILGELGVFCADRLGWPAAATLALRGGLTGAHMGASTGIGELARLAAARPAVRALIEDPDADPARLSEMDAEFAGRFAAYVHDYAHRTVGFDLTGPTLAERPATLCTLIRAQLDRPYDFGAEREALEARRAEAVARARAGLTPADRARFDHLLGDSDAAVPVRDEKVFYAVSSWALLRYALREIGARLPLDDPDDVFFLKLDELRLGEPGLAEPGLGERELGEREFHGTPAGGAAVRGTASRRRAEHAWALAHPGPPFYGSYPGFPAPDPQVVPSAAAERAYRVGQWSMSLWTTDRPEPAGDGVLTGLAASAGRYTGPVRVIRDAAEFGRLRRGDVLVCPATTAQWSVLFPSVGALVTDEGSLLSHPAIVAREYGVPAVVATRFATTALHDGQLVEVDGTAGTVRPAS